LLLFDVRVRAAVTSTRRFRAFGASFCSIDFFGAACLGLLARVVECVGSKGAAVVALSGTAGDGTSMTVAVGAIKVTLGASVKEAVAVVKNGVGVVLLIAADLVDDVAPSLEGTNAGGEASRMYRSTSAAEYCHA
jgi:hypothetical protein